MCPQASAKHRRTEAVYAYRRMLYDRLAFASLCACLQRSL